MEEINIDNWKHKEHFNFFKGMSYPHYNICFDIDITSLHAYLKKRALPFYYSLVYYFTSCLNEIEEFKYRYIDGKVFRFDTIHPSFTVLDNDTELFRITTVLFEGSFSNFLKKAEQKTKRQKTIIDKELEKRADLYYITSIPWISFTSISHTISLERFDSIPRVSWGKYYENSAGKIMIPFSVQVNHAFVDGVHIGKLKEEIERDMDRLEEIFAD